MSELPEFVNLDEFDEMCRTCGTYGELISMYERNNGNLTFADMVMECASIKVNCNDGFPGKMCLNCVSQVKQACAFKRRCEELDHIFHRHKIQNIEVKPIEMVDVKPAMVIHQIRRPKVKDEFMEELITISIPDAPDDIADPIGVPPPEPDIVKKEPQIPTVPIQLSVKPDSLTDKRIHKRVFFKKKHMKTDDKDEKSHKCNLCEKSFRFDFMLKTHLIAHNEERPFKCEICKKPFRTPLDVKMHQNIIHNTSKPYKCNICRKDFSHPNYLKVHMMVHNDEKPFLCNTCSERFLTADKLKEHSKTHSADFNPCKYCPKLFRQPKYLTKHLVNAHSNEPEVASKFASEIKISKLLGYKAYRRPEEYPFNCDKCDKGYDSKPALRNHEYNSHVERKYLCSECGKSFTSKTHLRIHSTIHNAVKKFTCEICSKKFAYESSVTKHMRIHTGEKPYPCRACPSKFYQLSHLKQHLRVHDGLKPYGCEICGKKFSFAGNLRVHRRIHTGERPYICKVCDKGFCDSSSLKKHSQIHTENSTKK